MRHHRRSAGHANIWLAIILIGVGVMIIGDNLGFFDFNIWRLWPLILIGIGLTKLGRQDHAERSSAWVLITIGIVFALAYMRLLDWDLIWDFWPVVLILAGLALLLRHHRKDDDKAPGSPGFVSTTSFFGGNKLVCNDRFEGGSITTIFGETKLVCQDAFLPPGDNVVDLFTMFGGVEISVPADWQVAIKAIPIFGGIVDNRRNSEKNDTSEGGRLVVKGIIVFGGLEFRDA